MRDRDALLARIDRLERTVNALVELLEASGTVTRAAVLAVVDPPLELPTSGAAAASGDGRGSPYRGGVPGGGASDLRCAACGKGLDDDEPELSLASRGRVCTSCFMRERE